MSNDRDPARLHGLQLGDGRFSFSSTGGLVWMSHGHFTGMLRSDTAIDKAFLAALHALADERERVAELEAQKDTATDRPPSRIEYDDDGELDEIVTDCGAHLERTGDTDWFLLMCRADGSALGVWIEGEVVAVEERHAEEGGNNG